MGGSGNFEPVQERADDLVAAGQKRHGDESLPPESRFSSPLERLFDLMLGCQLPHETLGDPLFVRKVFGRSTVGKRSNCGFRQAGFASDCRMGVEFVTRFPYRPNCEDPRLWRDSFTQRGVYRASCCLEIRRNR